MAAMFSDNAQAVLTFLQEHNGADVLSADIAEALELEPRSVTGILNGLQRKGLLFREEAQNDEGKTIKFIRLTDEGVAADPQAEKPGKSE